MLPDCWDDDRRDDAEVAVSGHVAFHSNGESTATVPDAGPQHDAASAISVVLLYAAISEAFPRQSMDSNSSIMEVESESRFVSPDHLPPVTWVPRRTFLTPPETIAFVGRA